MSFSTRSRILATATFAGFFLVALVVGRKLLSAAPEKVGDFVAPTLPGWKREVSDSSWSSVASYRKVQANNQLRVSLMWNKITPARTIQQMQKVIESGGHATMPSSSKNFQVQQVVEQSTSLNGMPAILTQTNFQTSRNISSAKVLRFVNKDKNYFLRASFSRLSTSPVSLQAQKELNQAWQTISQQLKP